MVDSKQEIPLSGATRITVEVTGVDLDITWAEAGESVLVSGKELDVERAADELFLRGTSTSSKRAGKGIEVSTADNKYRVSFGAGEIEHDRTSKETRVNLDFFKGAEKRGQRKRSVALLVPPAVVVSKIEVDKGDLVLDSPSGAVDASVKTGGLKSSGGTADLTASAGSGEVEIVKLQGDLTVMSGSGGVSVTDITGSTEVKAGSGEIRLRRIAGSVIDLMAGSGTVEVVEAVADRFTCKTGSGDVKLEGGQLGRIDVKCGSGDVDSTTVFGPYSQIITTGSGDVSLGIPRELPIRFEAYTQGGEITSDVQLVSVGQRGPKSRRTRRQVGSVGQGEPRADVQIRTASGDIRLFWLSTSVATPPRPRVPGAPQLPAIPVPAPGTPSSPAPAQGSPGEGSGADSADHRKAILEALARGEISIDEADALLRGLDQD